MVGLLLLLLLLGEVLLLSGGLVLGVMGSLLLDVGWVCC